MVQCSVVNTADLPGGFMTRNHENPCFYGYILGGAGFRQQRPLDINGAVGFRVGLPSCYSLLPILSMPKGQRKTEHILREIYVKCARWILRDGS
jgi:hypothetical protein